MKRIQRTFALAVIGMLSLTTIVRAQAIVPSVSQVWAFPGTLANPGEASGGEDFEAVRGARSELTRTDSALWMTLEAKGLPAGVYTVWWVIFNHPTACDGGVSTPPYTHCSGVADPAAWPLDGGESVLPTWIKGRSLLTSPDLHGGNGTVLWATAGIVGPDGVGHFSASLERGRDKAPGTVLVGKGLTDPLQAEVHLIVRWHGAAVWKDLAHLAYQLTQPDGGCPPNLPEVECANLYVTVHRGATLQTLGQSN